MGATSSIVAAVMIGLTVTGCGLTRQAEREAAQRAADDRRCRSYGFRNDADLARCRMQLDLARLRRSSAGSSPPDRAYSRHEFIIAIAAVSRCDLAARLGIDACDDVLGVSLAMMEQDKSQRAS
jgi:hypothetical protein